MIRAGRFPVFGDGGQRRSMVYVDNLVDGVLLARDRGRTGGAYWIADLRPYEVREIVTTVQEALRAEGLSTSSKVLRVPTVISSAAEVADRAIQRAGRYQQAAHVLGEMSKTIACDISAAVDELGYDPQVELLEGMRRSIRWCLDRGLAL
jgi:nucleoside-diphosphate-sugar epimerase